MAEKKSNIVTVTDLNKVIVTSTFLICSVICYTQLQYYWGSLFLILMYISDIGGETEQDDKTGC